MIDGLWLSWLFSVTLVAHGQPIPHARIQCAEIVRMVDGRADVPQREEDGLGAVLVTDSRGRMLFSAPGGTYHCAGWGRPDRTDRRDFTIEITRDGQEETVELAKEE